MPAITLTNLTDRIRNLIDDEDAVLISATEIIAMINHSGRQWVSLAATHQPGMFHKIQAQVPTGLGSAYEIDQASNDMWKLETVGYYDKDLVLHPLRRITGINELMELGLDTNQTGVPEYFYQQDDTTVVLYPYPTTSDIDTVVCSYTRRRAELAAGGDNFMGPGASPLENTEIGADWVIYDVCMKARIKERDDWQTFKALRDDCEERFIYSMHDYGGNENRVRANPMTGRHATAWMTRDPDFWKGR